MSNCCCNPVVLVFLQSDWFCSFLPDLVHDLEPKQVFVGQSKNQTWNKESVIIQWSFHFHKYACICLLPVSHVLWQRKLTKQQIKFTLYFSTKGGIRLCLLNGGHAWQLPSPLASTNGSFGHCHHRHKQPSGHNSWNRGPEHGPLRFNVPNLPWYVRKILPEVRVKDLVNRGLHQTFAVHPHYSFELTRSVWQCSPFNGSNSPLCSDQFTTSSPECSRHTAAGLWTQLQSRSSFGLRWPYARTWCL